MNKGGITVRLVHFAKILAGNVRGGLAHANIIASVFFAGMTGAAVSDTAAIGTMLIPPMVDDAAGRRMPVRSLFHIKDISGAAVKGNMAVIIMEVVALFIVAYIPE